MKGQLRMYETNINIGNELYFFKGDKVFSNVTMKEVVDVHGASRVCARDDGLLHVVRINRGEHPTEEVYDALGNKILKIKGMVVFGVRLIRNSPSLEPSPENSMEEGWVTRMVVHSMIGFPSASQGKLPRHT